MTDQSPDVRDELRAVVRDILTKPEPPAWRTVAGAGWLGLELPGSCGGGGATFREVAVILHEMGRAASELPYLGLATLTSAVLNQLEPTAERDQLMRSVAGGDGRVAVALETSEPGNAKTIAPFRVAPTLAGCAEFLPDAPLADRILLLALDPDDGPVVVVASVESGDLLVEEQPVVDASRRLGRITVEGADEPAPCILRFAEDPGLSAQRVYDRGALAVACDSLGAAEAMTEATVAYAQARHQFGRPIGSFQAVKHACADMLVRVQVGKHLVNQAIEAVASDHPDSSVLVSMAKSEVGQSAVDIVGKAMQLHGGVGYTWESGIHRYLKRVALNRSLFGSPVAHRRRLSSRY